MVKTNSTAQQRLMQIACIGLCLIVAGATGLILWAKTNTESRFAQHIRQLVGIELPKEIEVKSTPRVETVSEAPEPEPEPEAEEALAPEPKPERITLTFRELVESPAKWPTALKMRSEKQVPIRYNGNLYGQMSFVLGQEIQVESLRGDNQILGTIDGNHLIIAAHETDIGYWYRETYGESHRLALSGNRALQFDAPANPSGEYSQTDHLNDVRYWCYRYYDSASIEKQSDRLVLKWTPQRDVETNFAFEAREIARYYLLSQAPYGGDDNYASCDIYHKSTGELLGSGTVFIPSLNER